MLSLKNLNRYKEKISNKIDEILMSASTVDINNFFSSKHHYLFKIRPFNTTQYVPYAYLRGVRMHTENVSALININEDVEFIDYDNEIHNLNVSELRILLLEIQKNICSLVKQKNSLKENILNCSNLSELLEIKIDFKMMDFS